jgi:hypothetical protein
MLIKTDENVIIRMNKEKYFIGKVKIIVLMPKKIVRNK